MIRAGGCPIKGRGAGTPSKAEPAAPRRRREHIARQRLGIDDEVRLETLGLPRAPPVSDGLLALALLARDAVHDVLHRGAYDGGVGEEAGLVVVTLACLGARSTDEGVVLLLLALCGVVPCQSVLKA